MSERRCECCDFEWNDEAEKDEHVTYMQTRGLYDEAKAQTEHAAATGCEYGCPYGSAEHEARLIEWERTGQW